MATRDDSWGGQGGRAWDDGAHDGIRGITVYHGSAIDSIRVDYDRRGKLVEGGEHGGSGGNLASIQLDFPEEYLTGISGYFGSFEDNNVIRSLKFETNTNTYGPFGMEVGTQFSSIHGVKIVGFFGRSGIFTDKIGIHSVPISKAP